MNFNLDNGTAALVAGIIWFGGLGLLALYHTRKKRNAEARARSMAAHPAGKLRK